MKLLSRFGVKSVELVVVIDVFKKVINIKNTNA